MTRIYSDISTTSGRGPPAVAVPKKVNAARSATATVAQIQSRQRAANRMNYGRFAYENKYRTNPLPMQLRTLVTQKTRAHTARLSKSNSAAKIFAIERINIDSIVS